MPSGQLNAQEAADAGDTTTTAKADQDTGEPATEESQVDDPPRDRDADDASEAAESGTGETIERVTGAVKQTTDNAQESVTKFAEEVDDSEQANQAKSGILSPIYALAESMNFAAFHWLAFTFMVTGVISFALQLVLGKLVILSKMSISLTEILSDALGLVISVVGLVLTTQAATENSTFTQSAFAVLSATIVGCVLGFIFYVWGQRQELQAVEARRQESRQKN